MDPGFVAKMKSLNEKARQNYNTLMFGNYLETGRACWNTPYDCVKAFTALKGKMQEYTDELDSMKCFKYQYGLSLPTVDKQNVTGFEGIYWQSSGSCSMNGGANVCLLGS